MKKILHYGIGARQIDWPVRVGEAQCLLFVEGILGGGAVVLDVAAGSLIREPFADVAFLGTRAIRKFRGREWPRRQSSVQSQFVAQQNQNCADCCTEISYRLAKKCIESCFVDRHV
jgi:hypothetical protein